MTTFFGETLTTIVVSATFVAMSPSARDPLTTNLLRTAFATASASPEALPETCRAQREAAAALRFARSAGRQSDISALFASRRRELARQ